jgi:carbon monoxide dehydrogenase subunit G
MKIEERLVIQAPIERVWAFVREPQTCAPCVPGCEGVEALSDTAYRVTVGIALGPIKARFNAVVTITEEAPPTRLVCQTKGEEGSKASILSATTEITFSPVDPDATEIVCSSEASIVGRLGKFGLGIMKKRAGQLAAEFALAAQEKMQAANV